MRLSPLGTSAINWPIVPAPDNRWWVWSSRWNENWQGKPKYSDKTRPSATSCTTNPTCPDLGSNPGRRGGKPATNRLSYSTAYSSIYLSIYGSTGLAAFSVSWSFTQSVGLLWRGISPSQGRYLHTGQHTHTTNSQPTSLAQVDSNPLSQCLSWRRQFIPYTARPLWWAWQWSAVMEIAEPFCFHSDNVNSSVSKR
jgi:hypothetical protein